ncbi:hypothetical protein EJB05_47979, partial [Eragrostis curvula]
MPETTAPLGVPFPLLEGSLTRSPPQQFEVPRCPNIRGPQVKTRVQIIAPRSGGIFELVAKGARFAAANQKERDQHSGDVTGLGIVEGKECKTLPSWQRKVGPSTGGQDQGGSTALG